MTRAVVDFIAPWLVDHPEDVQIEEVEGERDLTIVEVSVHPDDMGKIIGKRGRMIRAIRVLSKAAGQRSGDNIAVEVVD